MSRFRLLLALMVAALALPASAFAITPPATGTFLYLKSDEGDWVGRGQELLYTSENASFTLWYVNGYFEGHVNGHDGNFWTVHMEAPDGIELVPGTTYSDLVRWPFNGSSRYGLSVTGFATGCTALATPSEMTVNELELRPIFPNEIEKFSAGFVQTCEGATGSLRGEIRFETAPDTEPPTLYLPGNQTTEAAEGSSEAPVYYGVYAYDTRDGYLTATCAPPSGSSFPVGTSIVSCSATDTSGNTAAGTFEVRVLPALGLGLTLDHSGLVNPKSGVATVHGIVSCSRSTVVYVAGDLQQVIARRATVSGTYSSEVSCSPPSSRWEAEVLPTNGRFVAGQSRATSSGYSCEFTCHFASAESDVLLRGAH
jgi:hypothetical protein